VNYTVVWQPTAENQLAAAWVDAKDRRAVTRASDQIDTLLGAVPDRVGESRDTGRRVLVVLPLVVTYEVIEDDKLVRVLRVVLRERPSAG
jgi:plasmid stabilization system protein ParE